MITRPKSYATEKIYAGPHPLILNTRTPIVGWNCDLWTNIKLIVCLYKQLAFLSELSPEKEILRKKDKVPSQNVKRTESKNCP
jgi:hypothetical protein